MRLVRWWVLVWVLLPGPPGVLAADLADLSQPGWDTRPTTLAQLDSSPFLPAADPQTTDYRQGLVGGASDWEGPLWHHLGTLPLTPGSQTRLGVNVFEPLGTPRGTLLFVHGYMARAADFPFTLGWFASRGWVVVTLDLPGHGLSDGPRNDIDAFTTYGTAVTTWLEWVKRQGWPGPQVLVAHSLGAAAVLEALRRPGAPSLTQVVFCAPLLRTTWYPALVVGDALVGWWLPGWFSADYQARAHWFFALQSWLASLDTQAPLSFPLTVYSGDRDSVVDAAWNREALQRLVPGVQWVTLPGQDHWFLSNPGSRKEFHEQLEAALSSGHV